MRQPSRQPPGPQAHGPGAELGPAGHGPGAEVGLAAAGDVHARIVAAFRGHSLETELYLHAVADRLDMTPADFVCLSLLLLEGPCTAGRLAERTGLSTGAITGVVDRLAGQGRVRREVDPADRRRVVVQAVPERAGDLAEVLGPMIADAHRLHARFSAEELETVARFVGEARQLLARHTSFLRAGEPVSREPDGAVAVPRGASPDAVLHVSGLPARFRVAAADLGDELCRVDLGGPVPSVRAWPGHVLVQLRGRARGAARGELLVHRGVRWTVEISGGCLELDVDLQAARLSGVLLRGGARQLVLELPAPHEVVPVRVLGGASRMVVRRPAGVPVGVRIRGGASEVVVDGARVRSAGWTRFASGDPGGPGYELELHGGASRLVVETR